MSKKTSYLLGILLTIIIGTLLYCYLCDDCNCSGTFGDSDNGAKTSVVGGGAHEANSADNANGENNVVETDASGTSTSQGSNAINRFSIIDADGGFSLDSDDSFNFNISNFSVLSPVSADINKGIDKLKDYLIENPEKTVGITGHYKPDEINNSAFPDLGLARANSIKNYFVLKGISSKNIDTFGELNDALAANADGILSGPVTFSLGSSSSSSDKDDDDEASGDLAALGERIKANPLVLNFNSGQSSIDLTAEQRQKIADISKYLDKVDGSKCLVTSHTDSKGRRVTNMRVSQGRADFAKNYLVQNGILADKIVTSSKGPDEPIASNATADGRAKNRRTVITIN